MSKKFKGSVQIEQDLLVNGEVTLSGETISRAAEVDGSGKLKSSATTSTELGYLSGVTSAIQTQIDSKVTGPASATDEALARFDGTTGKLVQNSVITATDAGILSGITQLNTDNLRLDGNTLSSTDTNGNINLTPDGTGIVQVDSSLLLKTSLQVEDPGAGTNTVTIQSPAALAASYTLTLPVDDGDNGEVLTANGSGALSWTAVVTSDELVKVSANDTTSGYLEDKVVGVTNKIVVSTLNDGSDEDLQITIGSDVFDKSTDDTADITEGSNLFFTDERAQDAIGTILLDTSSIDFTYDDATPNISAVVLPAGVDHDQLANFVANEHIDHSSVQIATAADSGLTGGGDITTTRNLSVDISGTTAETSADNADLLLIYDDTATALKSMTRANFLSGIATTSAGDISETSFSIANNQAAAADVTSFAFANGTVRSFQALVSVLIDATANLYEVFTLYGIQKDSAWDLSVESTGDDSQIVFTITSAGQIQYTSANYTGFSSGTMKFRAITTSI